MSTAASSVQCFITVNTKNLYCDTATVFTDQMSDTCTGQRVYFGLFLKS